ncbi:hypothetical protein ASL14_19200 [Paenibacillus sp. IHB B 3084]|uniref:hypothetical protein n=1 Tax=Paenibacillus sp. IHB B 3084 TaxID=867076 RepID=UPI00072099E0|nr:hypothetical protein [Paenibacillus sp. IHB B 3084]ALP37998.1 hypothetical protein ASL14_19200 [Paenibacillus sp. IHB B 3084]
MTTIMNKKMTTEEAIQMALEIERTEAALKQMKEKLKAYVDDYGALQAADKVWEYSNTKSWSFKADGLRELAVAITAEGKNAWDYLSLSSTALKKLGWEEVSLSGYGTLKETKRFASRKA